MLSYPNVVRNEKAECWWIWAFVFHGTAVRRRRI